MLSRAALACTRWRHAATIKMHSAMSLTPWSTPFLHVAYLASHAPLVVAETCAPGVVARGAATAGAGAGAADTTSDAEIACWFA